MKFWYWMANGMWCCALQREDIFAGLPGRGKDFYKRYGLIGRGKTVEEAKRDWESWKRCSDLVAEIY